MKIKKMVNEEIDDHPPGLLRVISGRRHVLVYAGSTPDVQNLQRADVTLHLTQSGRLAVVKNRRGPQRADLLAMSDRLGRVLDRTKELLVEAKAKNNRNGAAAYRKVIVMMESLA